MSSPKSRLPGVGRDISCATFFPMSFLLLRYSKQKKALARSPGKNFLISRPAKGLGFFVRSAECPKRSGPVLDPFQKRCGRGTDPLGAFLERVLSSSRPVPGWFFFPTKGRRGDPSQSPVMNSCVFTCVGNPLENLGVRHN